MADPTNFKLPSGTVFIQSSLTPPAVGGIEEASGLEKARETWDQGLVLVRELAEGVMTQLKEATKDAEEVTVEFGVNIGGKTSIFLVEGEAAANLKVTITWKGAG